MLTGFSTTVFPERLSSIATTLRGRDAYAVPRKDGPESLVVPNAPVCRKDLTCSSTFHGPRTIVLEP